MPILDKTKHFNGRKANIGTTFVVQDIGKPAQVGIFVAYCPDCKHKILLTRDEVRQLTGRWRRKDRSIRERFVRFLIRRLELSAPDYREA